MTETPGAMTGEPATLDYEVVGTALRSAILFAGDTWTFGRSRSCTETLTLPALSRVAMLVQHLEQGRVRVAVRQSNTGRVHVAADDLSETHVLRVGAAPVLLGSGNYTVKVELPPVVLRAELAVPAPPGPGTGAITAHGVRVHGTTAHAWVPQPGDAGGDAWLAVAALAVAISRYPELPVQDGAGDAARVSDRLREAVTLWCGHSSTYWINERLKDAVAAADLDVPERGDRLARVVDHYAEVFPASTLRTVRAELIRLQPRG